MLDEAHYVPGETLRIGGSELKQMTLECIYNPDRGNASWTWTDPTTNLTREDLPKCLSKCKVDPPTRSDLKVEWSGLVSSRPRFHKTLPRKVPIVYKMKMVRYIFIVLLILNVHKPEVHS